MSRNKEISDDQVQTHLKELLQHSDLTINIGLGTCRILDSYQRYALSEQGINDLLGRYAGSTHLPRIHSLRFELAMARLPTNELKDFAAKFVTDDDVIKVINNECCNAISLLIWDKAAQLSEKGDMTQSYLWYNLSLLLFNSLKNDGLDEETKRITNENIAKLHRNRYNCLFALGQIKEAKEALDSALKHDPNNAFTQFVAFKHALHNNSENEAIAAVGKLISCKNPTNTEDCCPDMDPIMGLVCLAAQKAFENNSHSIAAIALHHIAKETHGLKAKLTVQRCLIRLKLSALEEDERKMDVESAHSVACDTVNPTAKEISSDKNTLVGSAYESIMDAYNVLSDNQSLFENNGEYKDDVMWVMKIAWNLALQVQDNPQLMAKLFLVCYKVLLFLNEDESILIRQKTCLLMSSASCLEHARNCDNEKAKRAELKEALKQVRLCKDISGRLPFNDENIVRNEKSKLILSLYEFEALAKLTPSNTQPLDGAGDTCSPIQELFNEILENQNVDVKTLENVAALSIEPPANHTSIYKQALLQAIKFMRPANGSVKTHDMYKKLSMLQRNLLEKCLGAGVFLTDNVKQESFVYFNEVQRMMQSSEDLYPETEALWFAIRSWNIGANLFASGDIISAEKWATLALKILPFTKHFKNTYSTHMNSIYGDILSKKDALN